MGPGPTRDLVLRIREARDGLGLSVHTVMELLAEHSAKNGTPCPSESTVRSVLTGDLDKISGFSHEGTLYPLRDVLLRGDAQAEEAHVESLLAVIRMQEDMIIKLYADFEAFDQERKAAAIAQAERCKKCERDTAKLWDQIAIKDRRMERKDRWIAELLKLPREEEA